MKNLNVIYKDKEKQKHRDEIWRTILREIGNPFNSKILIFPGSFRYELDTVLKYGFNPGNIFLIEKSMQVLANLTRKSKGLPYPPRENILRMLLSQASHTLRERRIYLSAAHLDFCQNCAGNLVSETQAFFNANILTTTSFVAISFYRGREGNSESLRRSGRMSVSYGESSSFDAFSDIDKGRIKTIYESVGYLARIIHTGSYFNIKANSNMMFFILKMEKRQ